MTLTSVKASWTYPHIYHVVKSDDSRIVSKHHANVYFLTFLRLAFHWKRALPFPV